VPAAPLTPDFVPILSRGRHRRPSKGACFMELASFLAGEKWSDHPRCTHPLLGTLARAVNDQTSDPARGRLAGLIPEVIGLTSDDLRVDAAIALGAAQAALPVASIESQRVMAVSVLTAEGVLARLEGRSVGDFSARTRLALAAAPDASRWAQQFSREVGASFKGFRRYGAPSTVRCAVQAVAEACVPDIDGRLRGMLETAIRDTSAIIGRDQAVAQPGPEVWQGLATGGRRTAR
jgi:hypothetical protein